MNTFLWYQALEKPWWAPPTYVFGPVWMVLYVIIALSFGHVLYKVATKKLPVEISFPFLLNLIFNFAFTPLQFGLKNNLLAAIDILLVLGTLLWIFSLRSRLSKKKMGWVVDANIPYLVWVMFATILQLTITYLNF